MNRLASPLVLLAALAAASVNGAQEDPLTGVWEGRGSGDHELIPPEGFDFRLVLESRGPYEARAVLTLQEVTTAPAEAEFDPDTGELVATCDLSGLRLDLELVVDGETVSGTATGLGISVELEGRRTSFELPEPREVEQPRAPVDLTGLTAEDWREDLRTLAAELPARHANAFHTVPREEWERSVAALDARLPELTSAGAAVALAQLVARVGDAHTELALGGRPFDVIWPVRFTWYDDGLFVTAVNEKYADALATRVLRVGTLDAGEALAAVATTFARENDAWWRAKAPPKLSLVALAVALGIAEDPAVLPLRVEGPDGEPLDVAIGPGGGAWLLAPDPELVEPPLWQRHRELLYWHETLPEQHAVYFAYNSCAEDVARPMGGFVAELEAALASPGIERLVLDLRHNSGGNSLVLGRYVERLVAAVDEPEDLRVLIGPRTYSSGMRNALDLREAGARLYGEPTGGRPSSYGEVRWFTLPRSGLRVMHSTRFFGEHDDTRASVVPDVTVPLTSGDAFSGRDPVLERALEDG